MVSIIHREMVVDLIKLNMMVFDVILDIDWLHKCYTTLDCRTRRGTFHFPAKPVIEWEGSSLVTEVKFILLLELKC